MNDKVIVSNKKINVENVIQMFSGCPQTLPHIIHHHVYGLTSILTFNSLTATDKQKVVLLNQTSPLIRTHTEIRNTFYLTKKGTIQNVPNL